MMTTTYKGYTIEFLEYEEDSEDSEVWLCLETGARSASLRNVQNSIDREIGKGASVSNYIRAAVEVQINTARRKIRDASTVGDGADPRTQELVVWLEACMVQALRSLKQATREGR